MKLWVSPGAMSSCSNPNWLIPGHTLYFGHFHRILIGSPYLPRRKLRLAHPQRTRQRSIILLYLYLYAYRSWFILRILPLQGNLEYWRSPLTPCHNNGLRRLCPSLRPNVFLRCYSNHEPPVRCTIYGRCSSSMNLRRIFGR